MVDRQPVMLGHVQWQISPWRVLVEHTPSTQCRVGRSDPADKIGVGLTGQWQLRDTRMAFELDALGALMPLCLGGRATGEFDLIQLSPKSLSKARGRVTLRNTVWTATSGNIPLGSYRLDIGRAAKVAQLPESASRERVPFDGDSVEGVVHRRRRIDFEWCDHPFSERL